MITVVRRHVHRVVREYIVPHRKVILITKLSVLSGIALGYLRNARTQAPATYAQQMHVFSGSSGNTGYQGIPIPSTGDTTGYQGISIPHIPDLTHQSRLTLSAQTDQQSISQLSGFGRPGLSAQIQIWDMNHQIIFQSGIQVGSDFSWKLELSAALFTPGSYQVKALVSSGAEDLTILRSGMISILSTQTSSIVTISPTPTIQTLIPVPVDNSAQSSTTNTQDSPSELISDEEVAVDTTPTVVPVVLDPVDDSTQSSTTNTQDSSSELISDDTTIDPVPVTQTPGSISPTPGSVDSTQQDHIQTTQVSPEGELP